MQIDITKSEWKMFSTHVWMCIYLDVDFYYYSKFGQIHTHKKPAWLLWSFSGFPHRLPQCPPHYEAILEVPKCENGQKVTKKEAKPGKIVLFMKITSFFVCRKKIFFSKWIPWQTLMIALFSEIIVCCFSKKFFLKVVASTLLLSHSCV